MFINVGKFRIESSSFKIPTVNIGRRQHQRLRAKNVIDVENVNEDKLTKAIQQSVELLSRKDFENYNIIDLRIDGKVIVE